MELENLGRIIKSYRKKKGLTMKELAEIVEVSQATISLVENGKREMSDELLTKIISALDIPSEEFDKAALFIDKEDAETYIQNKIKTIKAFRYTSPYMKFKIEITTEPNDKLLEIEDEGYRKFLTTFHNRAIKTGLTNFFKSNEEKISEYVKKSYDEEAKRLMNTAEKNIKSENNFLNDDN